MTDGVSGTGSNQVTQSVTDDANQQQIQQDFSDMSVEEIMFTVLTAQAKEQKQGIDDFAAQIKANTLKATNVNNLKAAIDNAAKNDSGESMDDISTTWENPDGTTEEISATEAYSRLGIDPSSSTTASAAVTDQEAVDADTEQMSEDQATADEDIDDSDSLSDSQKQLAHEEVGHDDAGFEFYQKDAETSLKSIQQDTSPTGQNAYDNDYIRPTDAQVGSDIDTYEADNAELQIDQSSLSTDSSQTISQDDLTEMSANLGNYHDNLDGQNQIDMAKLQKDMDDYQTTLQTLQSSTDSMSRLSQKIGGSVGGG